MEDSKELQLEVWREVSRHIEIQESIRIVADLLFQRSAIRSLRLDRTFSDPNLLETATLAEAEPGLDRPVALELSQAARQLLELKAAEGRPMRACADDDVGPLRPLVPACDRFDTWLLPLRCPVGVTGLLVIQSDKRSPQSAAVETLLRQLSEPFAVALANDRRLHELSVLREAADADRRLLMEKLGRHQVDEEIVGSNRGLRQVMERVSLVASSDVPVLILGETGTGKEVISRAIHSRSRRSGGPFVRVNCGAIPPELIDSQLFGHEKGSFTGAAEQHQGWFERADGGTLFLDEIGELPLAAQVRLLRVLQDHQIERVGGKQTIHVDVRIVTATHRDLSNMVRERTFREDLWYRINVFPIYLPRLRDRVEDLPLLVRHFAQRAASRFGLPFVEPSAADLLTLASYGWPGNIRELGAVIDRAVILGKGQSLEVAAALGLSDHPRPVADSGPTFYEVIPESNSSRSASASSTETRQILSLDDAMREHIRRALSACRGQIEGERGAARLLGINPHTLRARMRKLEISWSQFRG